MIGFCSINPLPVDEVADGESGAAPAPGAEHRRHRRLRGEVPLVPAHPERAEEKNRIIKEISGLMVDSSDCIYVFWSKRSMHFWSPKAEVGGGLEVNSQFSCDMRPKNLPITVSGKDFEIWQDT